MCLLKLRLVSHKVDETEREKEEERERESTKEFLQFRKLNALFFALCVCVFLLFCVLVVIVVCNFHMGINDPWDSYILCDVFVIE